MHKSRALSYAIRKLELNTINDAYLNESPFKYNMIILEWDGVLIWFYTKYGELIQERIHYHHTTFIFFLL